MHILGDHYSAYHLLLTHTSILCLGAPDRHKVIRYFCFFSCFSCFRQHPGETQLNLKLLIPGISTSEAITTLSFRLDLPRTPIPSWNCSASLLSLLGLTACGYMYYNDCLLLTSLSTSLFSFPLLVSSPSIFLVTLSSSCSLVTYCIPLMKTNLDT